MKKTLTSAILKGLAAFAILGQEAHFVAEIGQRIQGCADFEDHIPALAAITAGLWYLVRLGY